jgi:CheY-like chemotaxis protein
MPDRTVLIVEDDEDVLNAVTTLLRMAHVSTVRATNGREALDAVAHGMPDVILLDMKMPVMDGWAFAAEFNQRYHDGARIVVMTAAEDPAGRAHEIGADDWIAKPFEIDQLLETVQRHMR